MPITNEDQELLQDPSVGPYSSFCLAALLALEVTELLDQVGQRVGHGLGPPARATTTFSLIGSIGRNHPRVKRSGDEPTVDAEQGRRLGRRRTDALWSQ